MTDQYESDHTEFLKFNKYKRGKIYKIVNDVDDKIYVGSTIKKYLSQRFYAHKNDSNIFPNRNIYKHMHKIGVGHFKIELIEKYPCENNKDLRMREEHYAKLLNAELNERRCYTTEEERKADMKVNHQNYMELNGDKVKEYQQSYHETHKTERKQRDELRKDEIKTQNKQWYDKNQETILKNAKEYRECNKDKLATYNKSYYAENKEELNKKKNEKRAGKVTCECGLEVSKANLTRHKKTKKHLANI